MAYPIRFTDHEGILRVALELEELGFDSALPPIAVMLAFSAAFTVIAIWRFDWDE